MRLTKNTKLLWIDLLLICAVFYFLTIYIEYDNRRHDYQITPLTSVSQDIWYQDNSASAKNENDLLQNQYELSASLQADVADAPGIETIEIYKKISGYMADGIVMVRNDAGELLTVMSSCSDNGNRNTIYLYEKDGNTMLMTFRINFRAEWMYDYQYEIFHLDKNNEPFLYTGSECVFFTSYPDSDIFPLSWMTELENYLADAVLLLSTEEHTLRVYPTALFSPHNI